MSDGDWLDAMGELKISLGKSANAMSQAAKVQALATKASAPVRIHRVHTDAANSAGFAVVDCGGPTQGFYRYIRSIAVAGADPSASIAGRVDVFVTAAAISQNLAALATLGIQDWRDFSLTIPNVAFYGFEEIPQMSPEKLWVVISGVTAGTVINVGTQISEFQDVQPEGTVGYI